MNERFIQTIQSHRRKKVKVTVVTPEDTNIVVGVLTACNDQGITVHRDDMGGLPQRIEFAAHEKFISAIHLDNGQDIYSADIKFPTKFERANLRLIQLNGQELAGGLNFAK
ncbi:MAG: hypothetical protein NUV82_03995 [Candidatus Komeilibacteria bacterium]|nr:hypothetical protein [Candidatus Komeilibacteria bacterium]